MSTIQEEPIGYFSSLCQELYNPTSPSERDQVQKILETSFPTFSSNPGVLFDHVPSFHIATPTDTANALRILLENSPNPYVQIFSFSRLKQLVLDQFTFFDTETKLQLRTFLLEYAYLHPDLQPFVITQLASVLALITRFGWIDIDEYQQVYKDINQFLTASADHRIVGLHILSVMIQDLNTAPIPKYSAKFRKAAMGFRDTQLFDIVKKTYEIFQGILNKTLLFDKPDQENRTKDVTLDLLNKCLSYDFAGISVDESGEDTGTIQIPSDWKCLYEEHEFVSTFFKAYDAFSSTSASQVMDCLVLISATRKALFTNDDAKNQFLDRMMQGIQDIISRSTHLNDPDCYLRFCRLLYRFRTNAPLSEMASKTNYLTWIQMLADFTKTAFQTTTFQAAYYLLGFWSRIIQNMSYCHYLDDTVKKKLQGLSVELTQSFVSACVDTACLEEQFEDPLEDEETLVESLNMLGEISRCQYDKSCTALVQLFEEEFMSMTADDLTKTKLTWFIYIIACFLGNRPPYVRIENHDEADGKLVAKVVQAMDDTNGERLDLAILYFFTQFKKSYVGETAKPMYKVLNDIYGIDSEGDMLNVIMRKIMVNLQKPGQSELMIQKTLLLLNELASGYSSLRTLRKMESTVLLLSNHDVSIKDRLLYYQILSKILFAEEDCEREFNEFMKPFEVRLNQLAMINTLEEFQQPSIQLALENIFLDLRGLIMPITSRKNYLMFFNWFYPEYMPVLIKGIQAWSPMTHKLLKFVQEFVHNKNQRLNLDTSSANSILLFRDVSQILCSYGQSVINIPTAEHQTYKMKYKGMSICFDILAQCLGGKYINFGVFWLYGDQAIHDAFSMMLQMMLNIPLDDMISFPKLAHHYFAMLDEFSSEQMMMYNQLPPEAFLYIIASCEQGIESDDTLIRSHACSTILHLCTFVIEKKAKDVWFLNYFEQFPHVVPQLLTHLFGLILFDDHHDPWQLSRPLYALVLLDRNVALKFTEQVILHQLPERRDFVTKALNKLMEGIGWTINSKDRERFSQQVATFKRELNNQQIVLLSV